MPHDSFIEDNVLKCKNCTWRCTWKPGMYCNTCNEASPICNCPCPLPPKGEK